MNERRARDAEGTRRDDDGSDMLLYMYLRPYVRPSHKHMEPALPLRSGKTVCENWARLCPCRCSLSTGHRRFAASVFARENPVYRPGEMRANRQLDRYREQCQHGAEGSTWSGQRYAPRERRDHVRGCARLQIPDPKAKDDKSLQRQRESDQQLRRHPKYPWRCPRRSSSVVWSITCAHVDASSMAGQPSSRRCRDFRACTRSAGDSKKASKPGESTVPARSLE